MCRRKGRLPNGRSTTLTIASRDGGNSASAGTLRRILHGFHPQCPHTAGFVSASLALSSGNQHLRNGLFPEVKAPGTIMDVYPPAGQLPGVAHGQSIHCRLCRKVWRKIRSVPHGCLCWTPDHQPLALFAQLRQSGTIHPLRAQDIDVIEFRQLFRCESFGRTKNHVSGNYE